MRAPEQCHCGESYAKYGDDLCRCKPEVEVSDFYERNKIARPVPNATSPSQLLDGRSRELILRNVFEHMKPLQRWRGVFLWSWVGSVTGHGSGYSTQICCEMGWDPDMTISPKAELPRTAGPSTRGNEPTELRAQ